MTSRVVLLHRLHYLCKDLLVVTDQKVLDGLKEKEVHAVFHYVPLHSSPAGLRFGRAHGNLSLTTSLSQRLIRLPMWLGLNDVQQQRVCDALTAILKK